MGEAVRGSSFERDFFSTTCVGSRKKTRVISDNGHLRAIVARLIKHPFREYHEYIRIFFIPGIQLPVVVLRLWGGAVKTLGDSSPMLL